MFAADLNKKLNVKYFDAVESGLKSFEIRLEDDCKYEVGKTIRFDEYAEDRGLTGRFCFKKITYRHVHAETFAGDLVVISIVDF